MCTVKYDPGMNESDPKALFQQQVPKSFQTLQKRCREYVEGCQKWVEPAGDGAEPQPQNGMGPACGEGRDPVMSEEEFRYNSLVAADCLWYYIYSYMQYCVIL